MILQKWFLPIVWQYGRAYLPIIGANLSETWKKNSLEHQACVKRFMFIKKWKDTVPRLKWIELTLIGMSYESKKNAHL